MAVSGGIGVIMRPMTYSLAGRLVSSFLILSLAIVMLAVFLSGRKARQALEDSAFGRLQTVLDIKNQQFTGWISACRRDVALWAGFEEVRGPAGVLRSTRPGEPAWRLSHSRLLGFLENIVHSNRNFSGLAILDPENGEALVSTYQDSSQAALPEPSFLTRTLPAGVTHRTHLDPWTRRPAITVAASIPDRSGVRVAILAARLNLEELGRAALGFSGGEGRETVYVVDRNGRLVAGAPLGGPRPVVASRAVEDALLGNAGRGAYEGPSGVPVLGAWRWLHGHGAALVAETDQAAAFGPARRLARTVLLVGLALSAVLFLGMVLLARRIAAPIAALTESAQAVARGDLSRKAPVTSSDQIGKLAQTFNWMTGQLQTMYDGMRERMVQVQEARAHAAMSEKRFRALIENASDMVSVMDATGRITYQSPSVTRILGYAPEEIEGKKLFEWFHPEDAERMRELMPKLLTRPGPLRPDEYRIRHKDGSYRLLELVGNNQLDDPLVQGFVVNLRDVTLRRMAEKALWEETERLNVTLGSIADGVVVCDAECNLVLMNAAAEELAGLAREEARGLPCREVLPMRDPATREPAPDLAALAIATGGPLGGDDKEMAPKNGPPRLVSSNAAPIRGRDGRVTGAVITLRDVTGRQRYEQELQKIQKLESVGVLAGGIAHDFNNILTGIVGNLALARMLAKDNPKAAEKIAEAETAALSARGLTRQLLTFAKGGAPVRKSTDMEKLLRETASFVLAGSKSRFNVEVEPNLPPAFVDEGLVRQAVQNLILNASQAMPGGGCVDIRAGEEDVDGNSGLPLRPGRHVRVSISDSGVGIPPENMGKIFDPYFSTKKEGSGLGLATTFSIVKRHGGHIRVSSAPGQGAVFTLYFRTASRKPAWKKSGSPKDPKTGHGKVLVMDDEALVLDVFAEMLRSLGYSADKARDGSEAVSMYRAAMEAGDSYDAVIMDLTIPGGMGGKEAMEKILAMDPDARGIVASGYSADPVMAAPSRYGFAGVICKPFTAEDLGDIMSRTLKGKTVAR